MRLNLPNVTHILWEELAADSGPNQMKTCPFHHTLSPPCAAWIIFQSAVLTSHDCWESLALLFPTFLVSATTPSQSVPNRTSRLWSPLYHFWSLFCPGLQDCSVLITYAFRLIAICASFCHTSFSLQYFSFSLCFKNRLHTPLGGRLTITTFMKC